MQTNYIVLAIPVFFALIALELALVRKRNLGYYRLADSLNNMATGIIDQVMAAVAGVLVAFSIYSFVHEKAGLIHFDKATPWPWLIAFIGSDLIYYWWHRLSHEINFLWLTHVVHHQSQEYNLTVALRQTWFTSLTQVFLFLPLALIGIDPVVFLTMKSFMILYQFWIHTRVIGKLGWFERFFNTPSHHRVHHGINPRYVDKNYGGTFIIWDRIFGTFAEEREEPLYGTLKPLKSWNPIWANFHSIWETLRTARSMPSLRDALLVWFKHPGWSPGSRRKAGLIDLDALFREASRKKFAIAISSGRAWYATLNFGILLGSASVLLFNHTRLSPAWLVLSAATIFLGLFSIGALTENRRWAMHLEVFRLIVTGATVTCLALVLMQ